ncbi:MAG: protease modulator HflC [Gammaproteobacteria bacterium]|nr:protease modulator HflC [Gammaproteobacteria bacterium]
MSRSNLLSVLLALAVMLLSSATFVVKETEVAIKLALGKIVRSDYEPGLHFKFPLYHNVHKFDSRILTLDARPERVLTSEKKNLIVDSFVKWRITDVERFFKATGGDERRALNLLAQFIKKGLLDEFGKRTIQEVISGERAEIMKRVQKEAGEQAVDLGITVVDVRVKRVDLPSEVSNSVFRRMEKERETVAKSFRSRGEEQAKGIRSDAERQQEEILAESYSESQQIRGEGDAEASNIYANAFGKDREFYNLYRSLNAYKSVFSGGNDMMLLKPDSKFFRYFNDPNGGAVR